MYRKQKQSFLPTMHRRSERADFAGVAKSILREVFPYSGSSIPPPCSREARYQPLAISSAQRLGYGSGASAVSITRRWPAPSPSSAGAQTYRATGYGNAPAAPRAAARAQRSNIPAGPVTTSASCRFRREVRDSYLPVQARGQCLLRERCNITRLLFLLTFPHRPPAVRSRPPTPLTALITWPCLMESLQCELPEILMHPFGMCIHVIYNDPY
jgi:hypothetical protein